MKEIMIGDDENYIDDEKDIFDALENPEITAFELPKYTNLHEINIKNLGELLAGNTTLTSLILSHADLNIEEITAIAKGLETNKTLTHLDLSSNEFDYQECNCEEEATPIAETLKINTTLTSLSLARNNLSHCEQQIAQALKTNTTLTHLDLSGNSFNKGFIAEALATNTTLISLNISDNNFNDERAIALAKALMTPGCGVEKVVIDNQRYQEAFDYAIAKRQHNAAVEIIDYANFKPNYPHPLKAIPLDIIGLVLGIAKPENPNSIITKALGAPAQDTTGQVR